MRWEVAVALSLVGVAPLSAQRPRPSRVEIAPVVVEMPRVQVDIPAMNFAVPAVKVTVPRVRVDDPDIQIDIPAFRIDIHEMPFTLPAVNIDVPGFRLDLSDLSVEIESAVQDALDSLGELDVRETGSTDTARVRRLQREWREAVRRAESTDDWREADALARELTRVADRLRR
ncbi:MAG TPA: hypothetical protein VK864_11575 [Longimicrobiales bacterium]|nr:hypothetical protein [Longimicrobiales bacterium]